MINPEIIFDKCLFELAKGERIIEYKFNDADTAKRWQIKCARYRKQLASKGQLQDEFMALSFLVRGNSLVIVDDSPIEQ